jgi:cytochrome bd-type quinol oxidase subunit 1
MKLDPSIIARIQFAFTVSVHIIFPTMSIGLASFLAVIDSVTGNPPNYWDATRSNSSARIGTPRVQACTP